MSRQHPSIFTRASHRRMTHWYSGKTEPLISVYPTKVGPTRSRAPPRTADVHVLALSETSLGTRCRVATLSFIGQPITIARRATAAVDPEARGQLGASDHAPAWIHFECKQARGHNRLLNANSRTRKLHQLFGTIDDGRSESPRQGLSAGLHPRSASWLSRFWPRAFCSWSAPSDREHALCSKRRVSFGSGCHPFDSC
jgi:hypothetical protein